MKNKALTLLLALYTLLSLVACSTQEPPATPVEPEVPEAPVQEQSGQVMETVTVNGTQLGMGLRMDDEAAAAMDENPDREIDRAVEPIKPSPAASLDGTPLTDDFYYYRNTLDPVKQQHTAGQLKFLRLGKPA